MNPVLPNKAAKINTPKKISKRKRKKVYTNYNTRMKQETIIQTQEKLKNTYEVNLNSKGNLVKQMNPFTSTSYHCQYKRNR